MNPIVTAKEMAALDEYTISILNIPGVVLMENAGRGITEVAIEMLGPSTPKHVLILCGAGNNGGDGYVVARHLINHGHHVSVYVLSDREKIKGDARTNLTILDHMQHEVHFVKQVPQTVDPVPDLIIDAMLGTGVQGELRGIYADIAEWLSTIDVPILAVDIPTGVNADTGAVSGPAVRATRTATMALPKRGLLFSPGREHTGTLHVIDIGMPDAALRQHPPAVVQVDETWVRDHLPTRTPDAHKNKVGTAAMLCGGRGMTGAATLCSEAALRSGTGLVYAIVPEGLNSILETKLTEAITIPVSGSSFLSVTSVDSILEFIDSKSVLAMGPGLGLHEETVELVHAILSQSTKPLVLDADGLNACVDHTALLQSYQGDLVITPHPGELSRLTGVATREIVEHRIDIAKQFAREWNCTLVLKGGPTVTATLKGKVYINPTGNAGMATAGVGDVLTGLIAGFIAQGMSAEHAAIAGVYVHGAAGDRASGTKGLMGMIAGDVLSEVPQTLNQIVAKTL